VLGRKRLERIADVVLGAAKADQTEVVITAQDAYLTRFAANVIHQNVAETDAVVRVRSVIGKRIGLASGNDLDGRTLARLVRKAEAAAKLRPENPEFRSLPKPQPTRTVEAYCESTAACTPEARAEGVASIVRQAQRARLSASGTFSTSEDELYVANSLGTSAYHAGTTAGLTTVVMGETSSGYGADVTKDVDDLDPAGVGQIAVDKALHGADPAHVDAGTYTVILEEPAVANMLFFLGYMGLGALSVQERRSFASGRLGQRVTGEAITIWDDGLDPRGVPLPFDFEGVPKSKVALIERGVVKSVVYDSFTAGREPGRASTGHALPAPNELGPIPIHLFMAPGNATVEEMIASTQRGILVTRFHYVNAVHPVKTVLTGTTRDGTFLIENGKVTKPVKNLRFTQSILEAFDNVEALGREAKRIGSGSGSLTFAPAAKISGFRFTGTTEF